MTDNKSIQRKRGVRASRAKLTRALTEAGLRTQAALAERIADLEGLDAAPKDVVNRVFREVPVELQTLERVARALGVESHTLYKASDEEEIPAGPAEADSQPRGSANSLLLAVGLLVALAAALAVGSRWLTWEGPEVPEASGSADAPLVQLNLGTSTLAVMELAGDEAGTLTEALRQALRQYFSVANRSASALTQKLTPAAAAKRLRTDVVIDGNIVGTGRLSGVRVYLYANGVRRQIWAESAPTVALLDKRERIAEHVLLAVRQATGLPVAGDGLPHFPLAPVQDDYLEGEYHLERPSNELNIKRAQGRFEAALRQDANYARAHAGLCQTLLEEHWMSDEERALKDAAGACGQALQLNPDDPVVATAHAHFLRRTGRNDEAIALYEKVIEAEPKDASAAAGLSSSLLHEFRKTGDRKTMLLAKDAARQATDVDPLVWKPLFSLGTMEWLDGNVAAAIAATEAAVARDENEYVLGNLGTFYLCNGSFESARDAYSRARELNPQSYVGDEFLGMAYYFLGDYEQSARLRQKAIDSIATGAPEIHEMWGNLGDSYRQIEDQEKSSAAYVRAAEIAERDFLRGNGTVDDRAARAYYYTMLQILDPGSVPDSVLRDINDNIDTIAAEIDSPSSLRRMAESYLHRGETQKARASLERAMVSCPGYGEIPELAALRNQ